MHRDGKLVLCFEEDVPGPVQARDVGGGVVSQGSRLYPPCKYCAWLKRNALTAPHVLVGLQVVTALGNILKSNRKAIRVALDSGAATALVALCDTRDPDTDAAARQAIANALVDGASHVVAAFSKAGAFPTIFAGLHSSDHRVVEAGNAACFELGKSRAGSKILAQYNQPRLQRAPCWLPSTLRSFNKS